YSGQLKGRKPSMIPEAKFHTKEPKMAPQTSVVKKEPSSLESASSSPNLTQGKADVDIKMNGEKDDRKDRSANSNSNKNELAISRKVESSSKLKDKCSKEDKDEKSIRKIKEEKGHRSNKSHREEKDKIHSEKRKEENGREVKIKKEKDEVKRDGRSKIDEKEQRASSVTSSSSQGSTPATKQDLSPVRDESERGDFT
ncbi:protein pxr-1-like, partial [Anneissia japonica]|uniref:protein pxr-1-like n=1 Tax=Anneissia japonica TaxID=1529436 RepID=UPI001425AC2A